MSHTTLTASQVPHPTEAPDSKEPGRAFDGPPRDEQSTTADGLLTAEDLLVEEVSIDGMCGVY